MRLGVVILAAGQGTRMRSRRPKVLHPLAGKPLLGHVLDAARALAPERIVIVDGHGSAAVRAAFPDADLLWALQSEQLGTGHALQQALPHLVGLDQVLVLYGDVPLIRPQTLQALREATTGDLGVLTVDLPDPTGYGRIIRDTAGRVCRIVEHKDASAEELAVLEINTGIMLLSGRELPRWLDGLSNRNAQGEYYLTDVIAMAAAEGRTIASAQPASALEAEGVNQRAQLARLERWWQAERAEALLLAGVTLSDPARCDVRGELRCGLDVSIDINCVFEGEVELGDDVSIGPNCVLRNVRIGAGTQILSHCVLEDADIAAGCRVGPFARLRPGTRLAQGAVAGNFVEVKNASIGEGSKVNHLSYIGDASLGAAVNIGAGTITCNYDGANKHHTAIGDRVFVGSNSALVAPVTLGDGATIGAGSVITKPAPADQLTLTRPRQLSLAGWQRPVKPPKASS